MKTEMLIKELHELANSEDVLDGYTDTQKIKRIAKETLKLLKLQEPAAPKIIEHNTVGTIHVCKKCKKPLIGRANYCWNCGQKVNWE